MIVTILTMTMLLGVPVIRVINYELVTFRAIDIRCFYWVLCS